jgi:uncharacterized protein YebE (UPF0316 family)
LALFAAWITLGPPSLLLPLLIFVAEACVVTLCTIRIIFVAKGHKGIATVLGFFEICIWLFAIGQIMQNLSNVRCYLAFAAGFTLGNYLGILIEKKLAIGTAVLTAITNRNGGELVEQLQQSGYGVTSIDARGANGPVKIIYTVIKRKDLSNAVGLVLAFDPKAFYSVDDIKESSGGVFPGANGDLRIGLGSLLRGIYSAKRVKMSSRMPLTESLRRTW